MKPTMQTVNMMVVTVQEQPTEEVLSTVCLFSFLFCGDVGGLLNQ